MKDIRKLNNREEVIEQLAEMLYKLDCERRNYQQDIYLYMDDNNNGTLKIFENIGGNSWINDDHITLYADHAHLETVFDMFNDLEEIAAALNKSPDEITDEVMQSLIASGEIDDATDYEITDGDVIEYVENNDLYMQELDAAYIDCLQDSKNYDDIAREIIRNREKEAEIYD